MQTATWPMFARVQEDADIPSGEIAGNFLEIFRRAERVPGAALRGVRRRGTSPPATSIGRADMSHQGGLAAACRQRGGYTVGASSSLVSGLRTN